MLQLFQYGSSNEMVGDLFSGLENWCIIFNQVCSLLFKYFKYILAIGLILIGIMILLKFRGIYRISRSKLAFMKDETGEIKDGLKGPRLTVGFLYILLGIGILFNFLTYFLFIILDPLPDKFIFNFINFSGGIDPQIMIRIQDVSSVQYPHELTIIYGIALGSLWGLFQLFVTFYLFVNGAKRPQHLYGWLTSTILTCLLFGFTTCLPFFL
jgi:hypothetical protein